MTEHAERESLPRIEPVLKTLLVTDMVDSTSLVNDLGDYRSAQIFERHECIARELLTKFDGTEIDKTDGFLLLFDRPIDAVLFAMSLHDAIANLSVEFNVKLAVRAGIHLGEVLLRKNRPEFVAHGAKPIEVEGLAKPMAARIMSLAQGVQTLLTGSAYELARRAAVGHDLVPDDLQWVRHCAYGFKGIEEPQTIFEVGREGAAPLTPPPNTEKAWRIVQSRDNDQPEWRPAADQAVPGAAAWTLERKLAVGEPGELWLARGRKPVSAIEVTIGLDSTPAVTCDERVFLFCRSWQGCDPAHDAPRWQLADPVACIVVVSGPQKGSFVVLTRKPLTCGRDVTMDVQLPDPKVSRHHFEICSQGREYVIREVKTKNGVFVNGRRVRTERVLDNTDEIHVGETKLVFYRKRNGDHAMAGWVL